MSWGKKIVIPRRAFNSRKLTKGCGRVGRVEQVPVGTMRSARITGEACISVKS